jgi:hypothetical protein
MMLTKIQQDQWDAFVATFPFVRETMRFDPRVMTVGSGGILPEDRSPEQVRASYMPSNELAWDAFMQQCRLVVVDMHEAGQGLLLRRPPTVERCEMGHRVTARFGFIDPE